MSNKVKITILVDNVSDTHPFLAEHGWSVWVEYGDSRILFDTGQSNIIRTNAPFLGIALSAVDAIVLSHGHYDHTGGLMGVLKGAPQAQTYIHPEAVKPKYNCPEGKPCRQIGIAPHAAHYLVKSAYLQNVHWTEKPTDILPGVLVTGPIERHTEFEDVGGPFYRDAFRQEPDLLPDDQALFLETRRGMVVVLGCAHSGVVNTLDYIAGLTGKSDFYAVMGGMHLRSASPSRIEQTIEAFRKYNIQMIGPAHCTGTEAMVKLWAAFPEQCCTCSVGMAIDFS